MKLKFIILSVVALMFSASQVFAGGGHDHGEHSEESSQEHKGSMMGEVDKHHFELPNIGNAICPVSGEYISDVGEGKGVQIEHEGKIYNVCCKFCAKDFKKNPEKFIKVIEKNLAEGKDPGRDYEIESDHDEDLEHHEGGHEKTDQRKPEHDEGISKKDEGHHDGGHGDHDH